MHSLHRMYHMHGNRFGHTRMVLLGNVCQREAKLVLVRIEIVLVSAKDRCRFARMYLGHGNRFGHTRMVLQGNVCQVEACFGPFRDCVSLGAR